MRLLCIAPYPIEGASARLRVLQYFPHLRMAGIEPTYRPFMDSAFFRSFYTPGRAPRKAIKLLGSALKRLGDVARSTNHDAVFIHREAMLFGPPIVEWLIARAVKKPVIFDFDDAIHLPSAGSSFGSFAQILKYPQKTPRTIGWSRAVIAGNAHLAEYASTHNQNVFNIPTVVDAQELQPRTQKQSGPIVLGWIGTPSTSMYLESLAPVLREVSKRHDVIVKAIGAGREMRMDGVNINNCDWNLQREISDLHSFDIGLYPIVEDAWSLGKSGFKAVQYMAAGIPAICSPVGATTEIVENGVHGFLPQNDEQWSSRLSQLIEDEDLRHQQGRAGRERVENWYCLEKQAPRLIEVLRGVV
jgi:glycosyltransferase involved in cell wall biosynthesis